MRDVVMNVYNFEFICELCEIELLLVTFNETLNNDEELGRRSEMPPRKKPFSGKAKKQQVNTRTQW